MKYIGRTCTINTIPNTQWRVAYRDIIIALDTENDTVLRGTMTSAGFIKRDDNCLLSYEQEDEKTIVIYKDNKPFIYMIVIHQRQ